MFLFWQLLELNQRLNAKNAECESNKKEFQAVQASAVVQEEKIDILQVNVSCLRCVQSFSIFFFVFQGFLLIFFIFSGE